MIHLHEPLPTSKRTRQPTQHAQNTRLPEAKNSFNWLAFTGVQIPSKVNCSAAQSTQRFTVRQLQFVAGVASLNMGVKHHYK